MQKLKCSIDGHVHVYPSFDLSAMLVNSFANLDANGSHDIHVWLLTERTDCYFFELLTQQDIQLPDSVTLATTSNSNVLSLKIPQKPVLYIVAGQQIITSEGLEVCSLGVRSRIEDRSLSAAQAIAWILDHDGLPALNWAPGKWFFQRGKRVYEILTSHPADSMVIGDTSMRPTLWPRTSFMRLADRKGFASIAGSDPLPFSGEEAMVGSYAFEIDLPVINDRIFDALKTGILGRNHTIFGKRSSTIKFISRQKRIMQEKKNRSIIP